MPKLFFMFDNSWLEIDPKDYLFQTDPVENECILFLLPTDLPYNVLGMPLFLDYYSVHDATNGLISFAPHVTSLKQQVLSADVPFENVILPFGEQATPEYIGDSILILIYLVVALILFAVIGGLLGAGEEFICCIVCALICVGMLLVFLIVPEIQDEIDNLLNPPEATYGAPNLSLNQQASLKWLDNAAIGVMIGAPLGFMLGRKLS